MLISFHLLLSFVLGILAVFDRGAGAFEHEAKYVFFLQNVLAISLFIIYYSATKPKEIVSGHKRSQHLLNVTYCHIGPIYTQ